jgi:hypothetical protein
VTSVDPQSPVREGDVIAEKYRVERVLGVGGMGVVVAAMHMDLDERVALKFLLPEGAANASVAARFAQEARAAVKIKSEHVARVIDVGKLPNGAPFMVMEYLDGEDLERVLAAGGALPIDVAVGYVLEASEAIAEAHALGIVHRDLKPANLFLARRPSGPPSVKVLDFGISKATTSTARAQLTKTASVLGSPFYMSPEQMSSSKAVDARTDVWALGVVLFELLANKVPFPGDTMPELIASILQSPPRSLRESHPEVPAGLASAVERCLEKDPARRFADVGELARALAPFAPVTSGVSLMRIAHVLSGGVAPVAETSVAIARPASNTVGPVAGDSLARSGARAGSVPRRSAILGVAIVAIVLALATFVLLRPKPIAAAAPVGEVVTVLPPPADPAPTERSAASPLPDPPSPRAPDTATALPEPPPASSQPPMHPRPRHDPASTPPAGPHVDCDPPYVIDRISGHRQYKPECLK